MRTMKQWLCVLVAAGAAVLSPRMVSAQAHQVVHNFTVSLPSNSAIRCEPVTENAKVGLASARVRYTLDVAKRSAELVLPMEGFTLGATAGTLRLWVRGDGSGNQLVLGLRSAEAKLDSSQRRQFSNPAAVALSPITLDFKDWREVSLDLPAIPDGRVVWVDRLALNAPGSITEPALQGEVWLDDLRLFPKGGAAARAVTAQLIGPSLRDFTRDISVSVDARNFDAKPLRLRVRLTMVDRNGATVVDRDTPLEVGPRESREFRVELKPDNLHLFLPPFKLSGDVLSPDVPAMSVRIDTMLVMGNGLALHADMGMLQTHWFTSGLGTPQGWIEFAMGEAQRAWPMVQTSARLSRADVPQAEADAAVAKAGAAAMPMSRYAMRLDFTGAAQVWRGIDRQIAGNAFSLGMWVKGDGSKADLQALFYDYTNHADFWPGGWRCIRDGERKVCTLDFTDWRYIQIELPGRGIGANSAKGSSDDLDFPLNLSCLRVNTTQPADTGAVLIGPIYAHTQMPLSESLVVQVAYDDANQNYAPALGAWAVVQNALREGERRVTGGWELTDRAGAPLASGSFNATVAAGKTAWQRIDLAAHAVKITPAAGPLRLNVTVADAQDGSISSSRTIALAKPDSVLTHSDFERPLGYPGLKADGITNAPLDGETSAATTTDQAHGGKRSLAISWDREKNKTVIASIDPPLPGEAVEVSMWVWGDGSGVLFYPLLGDRKGIPVGLGTRTYDLFLASGDGPMQNAVRVDWTGWKQVKFRPPVLPAAWDQQLPVLPFVPSYPLGLHLALDYRSAKAEVVKGTVYVDDIEVRTHLESAKRVRLEWVREGESNVVPPGGKATVRVTNADAATARKIELRGGVMDWTGRIIAKTPTGPVTINPGQRLDVALEPALPMGAYALRIEAVDGTTRLALLEQDVIAGDMAAILSADAAGVNAAIKDEWLLRVPIRDRFAYVDEDWDWVEHQPGNIQLDTIRGRAGVVTKNQADPWILLGWSPYWAAGVGFEKLKAGSFSRPTRHVGQGVDVFMIPQRIEDWDNYVREVMRGVGPEVAGFVFWDNPDGNSSIALTPEKFGQLTECAERWRRLYCPKTPMIIGGMNRATALPYAAELAKRGSLDKVTGVSVRLDVGRLSPEDARVDEFAQSLGQVVNPAGKRDRSIDLTELDWGVERSEGDGLDGFDQAAHLVRSDLLLRGLGVRTPLAMRNMDYERLGTGLIYRPVRSVPPLTEKQPTFEIKPAWWALARMRPLWEHLEPVGSTWLSDVVRGRTRVALFKRKSDGKPVVIVWRTDRQGWLSLPVAIESAEDAFGTPPARDGEWVRIGKLPVMLTLGAAPEAGDGWLERLKVRDDDGAKWPQRVLASFTLATGQKQAYQQSGGREEALTGITVDGRAERWPGVVWGDGGGSETFAVEVPQAPGGTGSGVVLRKRYLLDKNGHEASVSIDGQPAGKWDLRHVEPELNNGLRVAEFFVDAAAVAGKKSVQVKIEYAGPANSAGWTVLEYRNEPAPLTALSAVHSNQSVGRPNPARNVAGGPLRIGQVNFDQGLGVFPNSLIEYSINGQFKRLRGKVGVDATTEGRGSVVFEVWADGKRLWASPVVTGLEAAREMNVDITGARRLRLVVTDGGDGNKFDAADWCDVNLER